MKDEGSKGVSTLRLETTRFLVYQSFATTSNAIASKDFSDALARTRNQITQADLIPIGILNAEITLLNPQKKELIIAASPLQEDIFQANVQFRLSTSLLQSNINNTIDSVALSFDEGKNWQSYTFSEQLIKHHFDKMGEQTIGIKLITAKGTYVTFTTLNVKQLQRPPVFDTKSVSVSITENNPKAKITESVFGADYRIHLGCDGVFDKPIIIAEGFDIGNNVTLDDLTAKYYKYLYALRNNGYDLVLVNYTDGRTYIQNNAQVLKAVINQVNATKTGNNKLVVIGESMSGLVARYALRDMENQGQTHNVSHFVAFDSPMKGANVPPGLVALRRWIHNSVFPFSNALSLINDIFHFIPELQALDEPAAKQMLLTFNYDSPASEFISIQAILNNLGGYPRQNGIRNIALINGALDPIRQRKFIVSGGYLYDNGELTFGDKIMDNSELLGAISMDVWTNPINSNALLFQGSGTSNISLSLNLPINYDRLPGGRISFGRGDVYTSFSFVPTFSSIDYKGNLNNDGDYTFSISNFISNYIVTNSALTPFVAIYGDNINSFHAKPESEQETFNRFSEREFGVIRNITTCIPLPVPKPRSIQWEPNPLQVIDESRPYFQFEIPRVLCKNVPSNGDIFNIGFIKNYTEESYDGTYNTFIRIVRPNGTQAEFFNSPINYFSLSNTTPEGVYTIFTARRYYGADNNEVSNSVILEVRGTCPTRNTCSYNDGDFLGYNFQNFFVQKVGNKYYGVTSDGSFKSKSFLQSKNLPNVYLDCLEETDSRNVAPTCTYTEGQFLFNWYGENIYAHKCGTKYFVTTDAGSGGYFKPQHWLIATNYTQASCFEENDPRSAGCSGGGGCSSPAPLLSASSANAPSTLTATGCTGTVNWSNGSTGNSIDVTNADTYTATCTNSGCSVSNSSSITIGNGGGGSSCTYTEGQLLFNFYGENVYAHKCGSKYFVTTDAGSGGTFKPQHWLTATNYAQASCFEENDPRPAGCTTTPPNGGGSCNYTDGQFLLNFGGEIIEAKYCGGVLYARATWGGFKPRTWLVAAGYNATAADCFATNNPGCGALRVAADILEYENENFEAYPNPTNGKVNVSFTLQTDESIWLNLYDSQGKSILITNFEGKVGHNVVEFDLQNHPSGTYFINIQGLEKREVKKVIKIN